MKHFLHTLGVGEGANWQEIKEGYVQQIKVWHPDRFAEDEKLQAVADERTKDINYAYRRLKELRRDIEASGAFCLQAPFLGQYALLATARGRTIHGVPTREDRNNGYQQNSFGDWQTVAENLKLENKRQTIKLKQARPTEKRLRAKTRPIDARNLRRELHKSADHKFAAISLGLLSVALISIGALNFFSATGYLFGPAAPAADLEQGGKKQPPPLENPTSYSGKLNERASIVPSTDEPSRPEIVSAAINCDLGAAQRLLARGGGDLNERDATGQTALIWSAKSNCLSVLQLLLERKANYQVRTSNGFTAYGWAKWYRNDAAMRLFQQYGIFQ